MHNGFFLREFLRDPNIASVKETSPFLIRRVLDRLNLRGPRVVVEYGPGTGPFTRALLDRLSPESRLVLIESNPEFCAHLDRYRDGRVRLHQAGAQDVLEILDGLRADVILSGIPFSRIEERRKSLILRDTRRALAPGGVFVAYQASARLRGPLEEVFSSVRVTPEPFHIPPLFVLEARG